MQEEKPTYKCIFRDFLVLLQVRFEGIIQLEGHVYVLLPVVFAGLRTSTVEFDYTYFTAPAKGSVIKFKVKANNDAHFILTESPRPNVTTDNFIEVSKIFPQYLLYDLF